MPAPAYVMTGDIAWQLPGSAPDDNIRLWYDPAGLAGYVWFQPPTDMEFDLRTDLAHDGPIAADMLVWGESRRSEFEPAFPRFVTLGSMAEWEQEILHPRGAREADGLCLTTRAFESDPERVAFLERNGFRATQHFGPYYRRDLDVPIPESRLPQGMKLRHVADGDLEERAATHRDSWTGSSFDITQYREVRSSDVYDSELDIVLEASDGTFASACICWTDPAVGVGSCEPVGTRPTWRGQGIGREVIYEGFRRLKARGMQSAQVCTAGFNGPARALYQSCGFELIDICRTFMKTVDR